MSAAVTGAYLTKDWFVSNSTLGHQQATHTSSASLSRVCVCVYPCVAVPVNSTNYHVTK